MLPTNSSASEISLDEIEGERDSTDDFVFVRIGSSIPLCSSSFSFDLERPPSQPLSISYRHGLLFISHPQQGFFVVKTTDVIAASKEIKEDNSKKLSVGDVCVMDVKIGCVGVLAVSDDDDESLLAAAVGGEILFYKIASLLNKMQEPAFSSSLSSSATVKDFKWQKKMADTSFVVLSTRGSLYHSASETKLNKIMDGVDAVDWSREGDHIAVARKHSIHILSSDFEEILNMSLIFKPWQTLTDSGGTVVVDSIKWLLDDSIILGCYQLDEDGAEEGYLIQVIKSQEKKFSEMPCNPIVYSFSDLFDGVWDILPSGFGPYLLANYLDHWGTVLLSNKKAVDQHISLLKWSSMDDNNKVIALELISDKYTPKIEVPVIGDENLVFGFCIGTVPTYEKINIKVDENVHELSPRYALFCLTSEGRLILFHAARISEPIDLHQTLPHLDDGDVEQRQFNTNFVNESIAEPVCIQISSSKDLPKQINMESLNFQKGTFELPGHAISPPKQPVGTFTGQTGKSNNLFSDTVSSGGVESSVASKGAFAFSSHGGATDSYIGSESTSKTHRDNQNEAHQRSNSSIFHHGSQLASSKDFSMNSQPSTLSSYKSSVVSKGAFASSSHDGATFSYFGSESTNNKTYCNNQIEAQKQSNPSIFFPSNQLASGKDFTAISQPSTFSEKSSYKSKENIGNSLSTTSDANNSHMLQGSDVAEHEESLHTKLDMSTAQSLLERIRASKSQDNTKQFYNVRDMTEELDILMSYIEKEGGFMDACTSYQENSVHVLDDLWHLSERSRNCQKSMDVQLMDIRQLQNKMLQVSARQSYVKGLVELASNKTYWYIWNRWKLDPELEVKQRNILNANQNLTGEIIELERYFNALEINKFGDIGGTTLDHAAFRSHQASLRRKPLLQSLSNTVDFQLSAAEQLSELLSRQTSNLNINSCPLEKKGITHEFFGSISLPQEHNSFQSPSPACKSVSLLQSSIRRTHLSTTNSLEGYNQQSLLNLINTSEPGAARRRRDSLDRNWTTFKSTTVKRETPQKFFRVEKDVPFRKAKQSFDAKKKDFEAHQKRVLDNGSKQQLEVGSKVIPMRTNDTTGSPSMESSSNQVVGLQRTSTSSPSPSHSFSTVSGMQSCTNNSTSSSESTTATTAPLTSASMTSMPFGDSSFSGRLGDSISSTLAATSASLSAHPILLSSSSSTLAATSASLSACPVSSSSSSSSSPLSSTSALPLSTSSSSSLLPYSSSFGRPLFSVFTSSSTAHVSTTVAISTDKPNSDLKLASPKSTMSEKVETSLSLPNSSSGSLPTNNTNMQSFVSQPQSAASSSITTLSSTEDKSKPSDANLSDQEVDGMEEEDSDTEGGLDFSRIGLGSTISSTPPKQISFGGSFLTASSSSQCSESSPFTLQTSPGQGEVSRPASFTIPSVQPTQPSSSSPQVAFSEFGQTSKIGGGPQALGPILGSFGVSREISAGTVQNSGSSSTNNVINRGFGFTTAAVKGGFAAVASGGSGGFGASGSGGGFSGAGSGGGFVGTHSGGGFGGAGSNASSGFCPAAGCFGSVGAASGFKSDGFGSFKGGGGMFASFGGNNASSGARKPPASFYTQMRK